MTGRMRGSGAALVVTFFVAGLLSACGSSTQSSEGGSSDTALTKVRFSPGFSPNGGIANVAVGIGRGYFREEGLDVEIVAPNSTADAFKLITSGDVEVGIVHSVTQVVALSQDVPVTAVAATPQWPLHGVMSRPDLPIKSLKELEGRTVGMTGIPGNQILLDGLLAKHGVDASKINFVTVNFNGAEMLAQKRVDALGDATMYHLVVAYNRLLGKSADDSSTYSFLSYRDLGVIRYYILNLAVADKYLKENGETMRKFLRAWGKSTRWAIDNPDEAGKVFVAQYPDVELETATVQWKRLSADIESEETREHGLGWQDMDTWKAIEEFLSANGVTKKRVDVTRSVTNDYLPGK